MGAQWMAGTRSPEITAIASRDDPAACPFGFLPDVSGWKGRSEPDARGCVGEPCENHRAAIRIDRRSPRGCAGAGGPKECYQLDAGATLFPRLRRSVLPQFPP